MALGYKSDGPPLSVPPTETVASGKCSVDECPNPVVSKGLCRSHYSKKRRERENGAAPAAPTERKAETSEVTRDAVEAAVMVTMGALATFVDESYSPMDDNHKPLPRVQEAIDDMMPWMRIYGGFLVKQAPWFGLIGGIAALAMPAIDPTLEIISGIRKPRIMRNGPKDIYTEAYQAHIARAEAKAKAAQAKEDESKDDSKTARGTVVEVPFTKESAN